MGFIRFWRDISCANQVQCEYVDNAIIAGAHGAIAV